MFDFLLQTNNPILIAGPTASGKSALGLEIAELTNGCIINADALQVYEDWHILTARPSTDDESQCPHSLYGHIGLTQEYSVGHWLKEVQTEFKTAKDKGLRPIILGGTGLYFSALINGLTNIPAISDEIRARATKHAKEHGLGIFAEDLKEQDPETYAAIDVKNPARTQRAWEVLQATGRGITKWQKDTPPPLLSAETTDMLNLNCDIAWLNKRIEKRFDLMIDAGALDECKRVLENGWDPTLPSCKAIGAKELISYILGELSLEDAIESAKTQTRRYAKRQRTWFRGRMKDWKQLHYDTENENWRFTQG